MLSVSQKCLDALLAPVRFVKPQVLIYFSGEEKPPTDVTEDLIGFDTLEEVTSSSDLPFGKVSFNELFIELDNFHKYYSITNNDSPYANQLVSGVKVVIKYSVEVSDDVFETFEAGTFYTDAWAVNNENATATVTCYDLLSLYANVPVARFKMRRNIPIKDAFVLLFKSAGIDSNAYTIDSTITGTLSYFWGTGLTLIDCLDDLSMQTGVNIFVDKKGLICVKSIKTMNNTPMTLRDDNVIISANGEPSYSNVYSGVNISYKQKIESGSEELLKITSQVLVPGLNTLEDLVFKADPVVSLSSITIKAPEGVYIQDYTHNDRFITINIQNPLDENVYVDLSVCGYKVDTADVTMLVEQPNGTNNVMDVSLPMVCSKSYALALAQQVLSVYTRYMPTIVLDVRAIPIIDIGDSIIIDSPTATVAEKYIVQTMNTSYREGLLGSITARAL